MNIFYAQFATVQVVRATGVPNPTLQSWIKRGVIVAQRPDAQGEITGAGSPGLHRRFSFFNVMEIAVAKALIDVGLGNLEHAFKAAWSFAHTGGQGVGGSPDRLPSLPFNGAGRAGSTLVAVRGDRSTECFWESGKDSIPAIQHALQSKQGFVAIDADEVFWRVVPALGYQPQDVMDLAYDVFKGEPK